MYNFGHFGEHLWKSSEIRMFVSICVAYFEILSGLNYMNLCYYKSTFNEINNNWICFHEPNLKKLTLDGFNYAQGTKK